MMMEPMALPELAYLQLLAEIDALLERLDRWAAHAPAGWPPAESCRALVRRLAGRATALRLRLEAPLVVATLGGTGTGKSALANALAGAEVVRTGRQRPTTARPTLVCRPGLTAEMLGIDPASVELVSRDLPALAELVLVDCPDPDTTEERGEDGNALPKGTVPFSASPAETTDENWDSPQPAPPGSNLARLRAILPHCDVLLVTTTQQKYRSARVSEELAAAADGARLVFVQTHADQEQDIRADWRQTLAPHYATGPLFLVDSLSALADAQQGLAPRGEFAALRDLLTRQLAGAAAARIRRANFLDLAEQMLDDCRQRLDRAMPPVERLQTAMEEQRLELARRLARQTRGELLGSRRQWENRLLGQVASRWGLSPFALVLRVYQGLGSLLSGALLYRARTPAQLALWGAAQSARAWQKQRRQRHAAGGVTRAVAGCWDEGQLRTAAIVLEGYAAEAGFPPPDSRAMVAAEADRAGLDFVARVSAQLDGLVTRLAERHTGWFTRWRYELLLAAMLGMLVYRLGKNFFYDSWWAEKPVPVWGLDAYLCAAIWLLLWCLLLLGAFTRRLRRGLTRQIDQLAEGWAGAEPSAGLFAGWEDACRRSRQFRQELIVLQEHVGQLRRQLALPEELGERRPSQGPDGK